MSRTIHLFLILILLFSAEPVSVFAQSSKGQSIRMHKISLAGKKSHEKKVSGKTEILFTSDLPLEKVSSSTKKAVQVIDSTEGFRGTYSTLEMLVKKTGWLKKTDLLWIHLNDNPLNNKTFDRDRLRNSLNEFLSNGGKLFLTNQAVHLLNGLGFESVPLRDSLKECKDRGYGRRVGFHAFRKHPVFAGLHGGAYIQIPDKDSSFMISGYFGEALPKEGKVVAVDWDYIFLREESKLVLEYDAGTGKILAVGGYIDFALPNRNSSHLQLFIRNCLQYLLNNRDDQQKFYWNYQTPVIAECPAEAESDRLVRAVPEAEKWPDAVSPLTLSRHFSADQFWDVAGERLLVMGTENGGIEEVWAHPFMAFRDYSVGLRFSYKDSIFWLNDEKPEVVVNPSDFTRIYKFSRAYLKEVITVHPDQPAGVVHYEYEGVYPAELVITFISNFRWMWPYSEKVTGSLCHQWNNDRHFLRISDYSGDLQLLAGGSKVPGYHLSGRFESFQYRGKDIGFQAHETTKPQIGSLMTFPLEMSDRLDLIFSASNQGFDSTYQIFNQFLYNRRDLVNAAQSHADQLLKNSLTITTPDPVFNLGYRWSLLATDRFFVNTPGLGKALVAGYSTTRKGWDGEHKVNGRPGYGWYFGRDAQWSGFAVLGYGDFSGIRSQLEFFNQFQDLNGKIFHEVSTSGLVHYDAADATPLYICLAGRYFRHSFDTSFIRKIWPNVKKAIDFCYSTDTDSDQLIENTNVGHGWVEGGKLFGSHSTIYMAGAWGAALREAAGMARFLGDPAADQYRSGSAAQSEIIGKRFWSDQNRFYAYGMDKNGSFRHVQTILPAVPVYFGMTDPEKAALCTREYAGNAFTTNWGVRILREDNPWFKPQGYHYGSVWPLFTGWAALADYTIGNGVAGYSHIMNNLQVYRHWGLGFIEEVLNGEEYQPSGVCPHQCWSETMVLQPAIEGLLGFSADAPNRKMTLAPNLPAHWDSLQVAGIRVADQTIDFRFQRKNGLNRFIFHSESGNGLTLNFNPYFPAGTTIEQVRLNGKDLPVTLFTSPLAVNMFASFSAEKETILEIETKGGISVLPVVQNPKPGDRAEGTRIVSQRFQRGTYTVVFEGVAGSSDNFEVWSDGNYTSDSENLKLVNESGDLTTYEIIFPASAGKYQQISITWKKH